MSDISLPLISGYRIESVLGSGGFGTSYLAQSEVLNTRCVIKQLSFERLQDWKSLELFERESQTLERFDHPRIPRFVELKVESHEDQENVYLIQAYMPGASLKDRVEQGQYYCEADIIQIALQLAEVLIYLQSFQPPLIHRDIKPGNIILDENNEAYLIDFGAVGNLYTSQQGSSTMIGTFGYMAPEQFQGRATTTTDIYGLGATLLYGLTHRDPQTFASKGLKLDFRAYINTSVAFAEILDKMLEPDWERRYTLGALRQDLIALQTGQLTSLQEVRVVSALLTPGTPPSRGLNKWVWGFASVSGLVIAIVFFFQLTVQAPKKRPNYDPVRDRLQQVLEDTYKAEHGQLDPAREQALKQKLDQVE